MIFDPYLTLFSINPIWGQRFPRRGMGGPQANVKIKYTMVLTSFVGTNTQTSFLRTKFHTSLFWNRLIWSFNPEFSIGEAGGSQGGSRRVDRRQREGGTNFDGTLL